MFILIYYYDFDNIYSQMHKLQYNKKYLTIFLLKERYCKIKIGVPFTGQYENTLTFLINRLIYNGGNVSATNFPFQNFNKYPRIEVLTIYFDYF